MECTNEPCSQCPWRVENHSKRHKNGFFTKANRQRLWNEIRGGGGIQSCHLTDASHPDHVEAGANPNATKKPKECMGSVVLVVRELKHVMELSDGKEREITTKGINAYFEETKKRKGLKRNGLIYYLLGRTLDPPLGDGKLPDPEKLVDADWIGR